MERQERCLKASIDKQVKSVILLKEWMSQQSSTFCEAINQHGQKIDLMCNVFTGCFNQLYRSIGVKALISRHFSWNVVVRSTPLLVI